MTTLLPVLRDLLIQQFVTPSVTVPNAPYVEMVKISPRAWIEQNLNAVKWPFISIWEDRTTYVKDKIANDFEAALNVVITVWYNLTDADKVLFNKTKGIYPLSDAVFAYLNDNKKLRHTVVAENGTESEACEVTGMRLPFENISFEVSFGKNDDYGGSFYCVGRSMLARFYRAHRMFGSAENNARDVQALNYPKIGQFT